MKKVAIIGSGFSGISSACFLAKHGFDVTVFEKNDSPGGRARKFKAQGYTFDMGPSWYWMPDVFESFFKHFGKLPSDYYQLERVDPSYRIFYAPNNFLDMPAGIDGVSEVFEQLEPGSSKNLLKFIEEAKYKYEIGVHHLVYNPGLSMMELMDIGLLKGVFKLHVFQSMSSYIRKFFKHPHLIHLLEFPVLFLGASPQKTPALYSLMNYADIALGTWYPQGGMSKIIEAMVTLASSLGVKFKFNSAVQQIIVSGKQATGLRVNEEVENFHYVVASADYHHVEQHLIAASHRRYDEAYWQKRLMAPSSLVFYLGVNKSLKNLLHHNLFFDQDFSLHTKEIFEEPSWPTNPLFYVCCPSKSDPTVAPPGHENVFILIPVAPGLQDNEEIRKKYYDLTITRLEKLTGQPIRQSITFTKSYAHLDFITDYNAFKGNAYGLANTMMQTAHLKPSIVNKKISNLFYAGQLTVPGPGVPPALISGEIAARELIRQHNSISLTEPAAV
ncbi:phytoene desaturase [Chryseolinea serpens]|uniref:Phytoene desaturase n=1 Tax=Chryseolinea serpens TaxID=947013 RepID=A0A1M5XT37_9BACT|nr:phytoene desaturase family protein [Chryseolinea serpens]SHI02872.1 phytoene desaturase [Chryseolinea serpens]